MIGFKRGFLSTLIYILIFMFGFVLVFASCSGDDGDDDSRGGDDDTTDDDAGDGDDDSASDCEKSCLDSWTDDYVECLNTLISCLNSGGNPQNCLSNAASCLGAAESDMCICGDNCNSNCIADLCTCREGCAGDKQCIAMCFTSFSSCTGWFDGNCYNGCESTLQSCLASCIQAQDFSGCFNCVSNYSSCVDNCY